MHISLAGNSARLFDLMLSTRRATDLSTVERLSHFNWKLWGQKVCDRAQFFYLEFGIWLVRHETLARIEMFNCGISAERDTQQNRTLKYANRDEFDILETIAKAKTAMVYVVSLFRHFCFRHRWTAWVSIGRNDARQVHGTTDHVIPCTESQKLQQASNGAELWLVDNADHNGAMLNGLYQNRLKAFYDR